MLGERIKILRNEKGLTLKQLGEILNLGESTMSMYENDKRSPDYNTLKNIANYFQVSSDYLLGLTYERTSMIPQVDIKIGAISKTLRLEKGFKQDQLSEMLNVKRQTYSAWERNVSNPDINTIIFLSNLYNVSTDYLLGKTDTKNIYEIQTIAADHDGDEWTEEELSDIEKFKEYVRTRRGN